MSVIEDALRTAEAEAEKQKLESEGFSSLSNMIRLPAESGSRSTRVVVGALVAALLVLGGGGWVAYRTLAGSAGESADRISEVGATASTSGAAKGPGEAAGGTEVAFNEAGTDPTPPEQGAEPVPIEQGAEPTTAGAGTGPGPSDPGREAQSPAAGGEEEEVGAAAAPEDSTAEDPIGEYGNLAGSLDQMPVQPVRRPTGGAVQTDQVAEPTEPPVVKPDPDEEATASREREVPERDTDPRAEANAGFRPEATGAEADRAASERSFHLFRQAASLAEAGDLEGAVDRYRRAVAADPGHLDAYNNLGVLLTRTGHPDSATRVLEAALSREPGHKAARTNLGIAHLEQGRLREALDAFREVLASGSAPLEAHVNLGIAYRRMGRYDDAVRALRAVLRRAPDHPAANYNLALVLEEMGRAPEAIRHYSAYLESGAGDSSLRTRVQAHLDDLRRGGWR